MRGMFWVLLPPLVTFLGFAFAGGCGESFQDTTGTSSTGGAAGQTSVSDAGTVYGLALVDPECGAGDGGVESSECTDCAKEHCADQFAECFGSSWQTDLAGGVCTTFGQCAMGCECGDAECFRDCLEALAQEPASGCYECIVALVGCEQSHCATECAEEVPDGGAGGSAGSGGAGAGAMGGAAGHGQ